MGGYGTLPVTGAATLTLAGAVIGVPTLVVLAVGLVVAGAVLVRFGWRRRRPLDQR